MPSLTSRMLCCVAVMPLAGCAATFHQTDNSFVPGRSATAPEVLVNPLTNRDFGDFKSGLTRAPMHSVGEVEVTLARSVPIDDYLRAAKEHGQEVGCDVLLDKEIVVRDFRSSRPYQPRASRPAFDQARWVFDCEVDGPGPAPAPPERQCSMQPVTGSHLVTEVCDGEQLAPPQPSPLPLAPDAQHSRRAL